MNEQNHPTAKYVVEHAEYSAIGDYANVTNNFPAQLVAADPGAAELRRLFEDVNRRLAALEAVEREQVGVEVAQAAKLAAEIQQGDATPKKLTFLETRLINIGKMAPDIGEVILTTLVNPAAGIALTLQKIAQKAQEELKSQAAPAA